MAITFICPKCKDLARLQEIVSGVRQVFTCNEWSSDNNTEGDLEDSHYDNVESTYECNRCSYEPSLERNALGQWETLRNWVDRHQTNPPVSPTAIPEKRTDSVIDRAMKDVGAVDPEMLQEVKKILAEKEDEALKSANPELLP